MCAVKVCVILPLPILCHWLQKFPNEGLVNVVNNVFDFDMYNKELRETVTDALHKHGIPVGASPRNVQLAKE